jgi:hypothetical protein
VIGVFADGDVSEKSRARQPLFDRLGEPLCDHDMGLTRPARVLGPHVLHREERSRHEFELLADLFTDARAIAATLGAEPLLDRDVVDDPLAGQTRRQGLAAVTLGRGFRRRGGRGFGRRLRCGGFEDFACKQQELVGVERLGLAAVEPAEELFELMLELVVEVGLLAEGLDQLADEPVGGLDVVGKWDVGVGRQHTINTHDDRRCD